MRVFLVFLSAVAYIHCPYFIPQDNYQLTGFMVFSIIGLLLALIEDIVHIIK